MIKSVTLKNFKRIENQTYDFGHFDLLVGRNNHGKSTVLQALAIWQYCVDEFSRSNRKGKSGIQIVLPNFTALPLPQFNLLWRDQIDRRWPVIENSKKKQEYIYIEILVKWEKNGKEEEFGVKMRYHSPQSVYAIPMKGWPDFKGLNENNILPKIVYVPPFSGLEPFEEWRDDSILKKQVGKAQPGSVLRNLLYRAVDTPENKDWGEIKRIIKELFSVELNVPKYEKGIDTQISCTYKEISGKEFDIISGGSGFHQTLTLLAFMYGYKGLTAILFDEPDAHMHTNLQKETLDYFKKKSAERKMQFIVATHSEELIKGVDPASIISLMRQSEPKRIDLTSDIITALADVSNIEITETNQSPFVIYVEGEDDERILKAWAVILGKSEFLNKFYVKKMDGGSKLDMKTNADKHFGGLSKIVSSVKRIMVFDYDDEKTAFHPEADNKVLFEWKRKNIENYLLVEDAWIRASNRILTGANSGDLFSKQAEEIIEAFFNNENLTLPEGKTWRNVDANIFETVDGKKILFEKRDSLFSQLKTAGLETKKEKRLVLNKEIIAASMRDDEIHEDIIEFFNKIEECVSVKNK